MDIVYIFKFPKNDRVCEELKYSLRSIYLNLKHDNVFIIGDKPDWIKNVIHIPFEEKTSKKMYNIACKLSHIIKDKRVSENFVSMWDDVYCLQPTEKIEHYIGKDKLKDLLRFRKRHNKHWQSLNNILKIFAEGYNYDLHHPYLYNKSLLSNLFEKYTFNLNKIYSIRSLYCNEYKIEGKTVKDNKIRNLSDFEKILQEPPNFFSTTDSFAKERIFKETMQKLFSNKSKYEI